MIQLAFPELTAAQREQLATGLHGECIAHYAATSAADSTAQIPIVEKSACT